MASGRGPRIGSQAMALETIAQGIPGNAQKRSRPGQVALGRLERGNQLRALKLAHVLSQGSVSLSWAEHASLRGDSLLQAQVTRGHGGAVDEHGDPLHDIG